MEKCLYFDFHTHGEYEKNEKIFRIHSYDISEPRNSEDPFTIGLHPWFVSMNSRMQISKIEEISRENNCFGIGEVGLDISHGGDKNIQFEILLKMIQVSTLVEKPLILHIVRAYDILDGIIKKYRTHLPWIIHGFTKNPILAKSLLQRGIFLSFGYRTLASKSYSEFFKETMPDSYFLETDDSNLKIEEIYEKLSQLTGLEVAHITSLQQKLYKKVFGSQFDYEF